ncbi:flagellar biosynthesis anti-sigma factor FlgM [Candidatus Endobugula sertula]|uniref:Negative regulator of flagellin synthesis n=1 Tax=Candidatus Endobugula sertula TaxID=62101 RepID=A0A1D2QQE0_9GAMM|nr:flagellar biosynthesis anti-sigma factor FlgM [Candidatus Endobugula sertula]
MVINTSNDITPKTTSQENYTLNTAASSAEKPSDKHTPTDSKDQVQLSQEALLFKHLQSKIQESTGIDSSRVEDIQQRIANGSYIINSENIAEKLIQQDS